MTPRIQSEPAKAADPLIGEVLDGKYRIERVIGRGGVGIVYLATRLADQREVVVKILAPNWLGHTEILARFDREVERLSGLQHPNIVALYDFGHHDGRSYMVMEYIKGEPLKSYLGRKGRLSLDDFVPIASQILKGMGYAHSRGLMHRDLNPSNIMLCEREGRGNFVKILDFGLAKLKEGEVKVTEQHDLVGTAGFLAPEQIKGEDVDLRVDVYALGVMFYLMLSGRMPFEGEHNATLLYKHVHEKPRPLQELLPPDHSVPEHLLRLIEDCLEKDPSQRPNDADEIVEDLIDCVPAAYFSLPKIPRGGHTAEAGSTMVGLGVPAPLPRVTSQPAPVSRGVAPILLDLPSAPTELAIGNGSTVVAAEAVKAVDSSSVPTLRKNAESLLDEGIDASTSSLKPARSFVPTAAPALAEPAPMPVQRRGAGLFVGAALALLVGAGVAYAVLRGGDAPVAGAPTKGVAEIAAALDRADAAVTARDYDAATRELDAVKAFVGAHPAEHARYDRVSERLVVGRLLLTADKLASEGNRGAAI
ncbi:MAG TPA: serine/threonine-protein kinase, partial [Nannocystaceae bacterium]|nr:serine/threonine-protein kinase [Nannocystaceae bacterium]